MAVWALPLVIYNGRQQCKLLSHSAILTMLLRYSAIAAFVLERPQLPY